MLSVSSLAGQQAQAQTRGELVGVLGCVHPGLIPGCSFIRDNATSQPYQINAASPRPDPARRLVIRLRGTVSSRVDMCMEGPILENIRWSYTRMRCPVAGM
jgi:hypothetical protein